MSTKTEDFAVLTFRSAIHEARTDERVWVMDKLKSMLETLPNTKDLSRVAVFAAIKLLRDWEQDGTDL